MIIERCSRAFDAVWGMGPTFENKFLLLTPLLAVMNGHSDAISYDAQIFWTGLSFSRGSRPAIDIVAKAVGGEDVESPMRQLGQILREGIWERNRSQRF